MPGANCSIYNCHTSRSSKFKGISIFKVPAGKDEFNTAWRKKLNGLITKDRVVDRSLRKQIEECRVYICEKHYTDDQIITHEGRKTLVPGAIPTLNMPKKSIVTPTSERKQSRTSAEDIIKKREANKIVPDPLCSSFYVSFKDLTERTMKLKLKNWTVDTTLDSSYIKLSKYDMEHTIPQFEVFIDDSLSFSVRIYAWSLPDNHELYLINKRSMRNITVSNLLAALASYFVCPGVSENFASKHGSIIQHQLPKKFNPFTDECSAHPVCHTVYNRASSCQILTVDIGKCQNCVDIERREATSIKRKHNALLLPAKLKAPISQTSSERIILAMREHRLENQLLKEEINKMKDDLRKSSLPVNEEMNKDFVSIMQSAKQKDIPPFMKLFWEEQQKYLHSTRSGVRYHPQIIKFCLNLASKSSAAYNELRYDDKTKSGVLVLPSQRTLKSYKNYIRPKQGINKEIVKELCEKTKTFSTIERNIVILVDEMKIQEDLVWDKHTGDLIGFVDLGDIELNFATLKKVDDIASHVLVYLIRGIVNPIKYSFANFATTNATASQLFAIFWKIVGIIELTCKLKVIAVTCDGASANRKFYRMHSHLLDDAMAQTNEYDVTYKTLNMFAAANGEPRYIYFFADAPHLVKTARNCISKSGTGNSSRLLWNNGMLILWSHISDLFYEDQECGLHLLPKLTYEHVKLNPFSVMNVRLAAQVLSESVSKVIETFGPKEAKETAKFCQMMDGFFDCLNIRNTSECTIKRKPFLKPFTSVNDERFAWLKDVFLKYFSDWLSSIEERKGSFTQGEKSKMFISWQTHEGLKITVHSVIDATKYLLQNGVTYVLTEKFCQDPLENYFGRQRSMGQRRDNPTLKDFGYNDNGIRNAKTFRPIAGNCREEIKDDDMDISP